MSSLSSRSPLSGQTAIIGIGQTPFTRGTELTTLGLHLEAAHEAIADAGLTPADIDGIRSRFGVGRRWGTVQVCGAGHHWSYT